MIQWHTTMLLFKDGQGSQVPLAVKGMGSYNHCSRDFFVNHNFQVGTFQEFQQITRG